MHRRIALLGFLAVNLAHAQLVQLSAVQSVSFSLRADAQGRQSGTASLQFRKFAAQSIAGAPFSGEEHSTGVQILADGTRITNPRLTTFKAYRDSQGRTRLERSLGPVTPRGGRPAPTPIVLIEISDNVEGYYYLLDPTRKVAYRGKYAPLPQRTAPPSARPAAPPKPPPAKEGMPQITIEPLGIRVIQGVQTEGQRRTTVTPVGFRGNDRPLTDVAEVWTSPQLQLTILQTSKTGNNESRWKSRI